MLEEGLSRLLGDQMQRRTGHNIEDRGFSIASQALLGDSLQTKWAHDAKLANDSSSVLDHGPSEVFSPAVNRTSGDADRTASHPGAEASVDRVANVDRIKGSFETIWNDHHVDGMCWPWSGSAGLVGDGPGGLGCFAPARKQ